MPKPSHPSLEFINSQILQCTFCLKRAKGKLVVGEGNRTADLVLVGEAPGKQEVETGQPFIGRAGKVLRTLLGSIDIDPKEVFITSAVKYLPKTYVTPKLDDIIHGREHLFQQLDAIKPQVIVMLGNTAVMSVLQQKISIAEKHGTTVKQAGLAYFISYHPAAPLYSPKLLPIISKDFKKLKKLI